MWKSVCSVKVPSQSGSVHGNFTYTLFTKLHETHSPRINTWTLRIIYMRKIIRNDMWTLRYLYKTTSMYKKFNICWVWVQYVEGPGMCFFSSSTCPQALRTCCDSCTFPSRESFIFVFSERIGIIVPNLFVFYLHPQTETFRKGWNPTSWTHGLLGTWNVV